MTTPSDRPRARPATESPSAVRAALFLVAALLVFRLWYASQSGMYQDEMYYWQWSRHPDISYYDQGPGVALLIRAGVAVFGNTPLGIRVCGVLLGAGTGWMAFRIVERWTGNSKTALLTLVLLNISPLISAGGVLAGYDGPQVFFWTAALYALTRTLQDNRPVGWIAVGILAGMGALCKHTMLLFAPCVLIFLLWSPRYRRWLATSLPYVALFVLLAFFTPVVLWNARHGWMGFLHTVALGSRHQNAPPLHWLGDFLGGQALVLGPFLFLAELYALVSLARSPAAPDSRDDAGRFFVSFAAPILAACIGISLRSKLEANWPAPAHVMGIAAVALFITRLRPRGMAARAGILAACLISFLASIIAYFPTVLTAFGRPISAVAAQKLNESYGWPEIAGGVDAARRGLEREGKPVFVAAINYRTTSALAYYLPGRPEVRSLYLDGRRDEYLLWTDPRALVGQNAVLCLDSDDPLAVSNARKVFVSVSPLSPVEVFRPGFAGPVKRWNLYLCRGFKGYDPADYVHGY